MEKPPAFAAGGSLNTCRMRSGQEVALDTERSSPRALVREGVLARSQAARGAVLPDRRPAVRGLDRLVHHFDTDIEVRMRVPDGPGTNLPPAEVRVTLRARSPAVDEGEGREVDKQPHAQ